MALKSTLLLDDDQDMLDMLVHLIKPMFAGNVIATKYPTRAIQIAQEQYFDMILVDVTINYGGSQFGGLEVYKSLMSRYGDSSILAYSQYINDDLLRRYGLSFNFIEKDNNLVIWAKKLAEEVTQLRRKQSCFVAMPFGGKYNGLYSMIKASVEAAGYRCLRTDEKAFTRSIVETIFDEIRKSKLVVFVATDSNPNVYYEAGYAVALGKEVLTITDSLEHLPFDIRDRNALSYGEDMRTLETTLVERIHALTNIAD